MVKHKLKNLVNLGSWSTYKGIVTRKKKNENKENVSHLHWKWWITASLTWQAGATLNHPTYIPLTKLTTRHRFATWSCRFIDAYDKGWMGKRQRGHQKNIVVTGFCLKVCSGTLTMLVDNCYSLTTVTMYLISNVKYNACKFLDIVALKSWMSHITWCRWIWAGSILPKKVSQITNGGNCWERPRQSRSRWTQVQQQVS